MSNSERISWQYDKTATDNFFIRNSFWNNTSGDSLLDYPLTFKFSFMKAYWGGAPIPASEAFISSIRPTSPGRIDLIIQHSFIQHVIKYFPEGRSGLFTGRGYLGDISWSLFWPKGGDNVRNIIKLVKAITDLARALTDLIRAFKR